MYVDELRTDLCYVSNDRSLSPLIPPILHAESDTSQTDPHEDHNEYASNVLNRDPIGLVVLLLALPRARIVIPPGFLEPF